MNNNLLTFVMVLSLISSCVAQTHTQLIIDTEPAEIFIKIIEQKHLNSSNINENEKIEYLISLAIYNSLSKNMIVYIDNKEIKGKDAYRLLFKDFPKLKIQARGDINRLWKEWWNKNKKNKALKFIAEIKQNKKQISIISNNNTIPLLPNNSSTNIDVDVIFCFDGNRGSYTTDSLIVMDMIDIKNYNIAYFTNVLSHELHHILYGHWLDQNHYSSQNTEKKKMLYKYQKSIIKEGIAQLINFKDYQKSIKDLYFNRDLIKELSEEWFLSFRALEKSMNPSKYYTSFTNDMWKNAFDKLKKYYKGEIEKSIYGRRPTIPYYLGYYLYYNIAKNGGKEKLDYVITHPEDLLQIYNSLKKDNDLIPSISDDIINIWKNNFKNENKNYPLIKPL